MRGSCVARANIALAKYWGKSDEALNLPAVPSVSLTLDALRTETTVTRDPSLTEDVVTLDGQALEGDGAAKVSRFLDRIRAHTTLRDAGDRFARVETQNHFPSASGLASSASGFAALAGAAARAYDVTLDHDALSALARQGSASAARSIYGGWVELPAGVPGDASLAARAIFPADHWDVSLVIALVTRAPKSVASRDGMRRTAKTSPYYAAWLASAPILAAQVRDAIERRDLEAVGAAMEASTFAMHASAWAAQPGVRYIRGLTLDLLDRVENLRRHGTGVWATMDAGPHVKALCLSSDAESVASALRGVGGVVEVRIARPGAGIDVS